MQPEDDSGYSGGRCETWPCGGLRSRLRGVQGPRDVLAADHAAEGVDDRGVELRAGAAAQLLDRVGDRATALVGAVGGDRAEGVAGRDDARDDGDLVALHALGIAVAIPPLVVVADDV